MPEPTTPNTDQSHHLGGGRYDFARWSSSEALRAANWTLQRLSELRIAAPGENRLEAARDLIRRTSAIPVQFEPGSKTTVAVAEALKTTFEQYLIVKYVHQLDRVANKTLRLMLRGQPLPTATGNDPGRDAQAELFAGVVFRAAGYRVDLAEPDLIISTNRRKWGVAVKRVKSDKRFQVRIRKAQRQLENQQLYGFVVVNPDMLLNRLFAEGHTRDHVSKELYRKVVEWTGFIDESKPSNRVLALMALATGFTAKRHAGAFRFEFGVYIHQQYVTKGMADEIVAVKRIGNAMYDAINAPLRDGAKPPSQQLSS